MLAIRAPSGKPRTRFIRRDGSTRLAQLVTRAVGFVPRDFATTSVLSGTSRGRELPAGRSQRATMRSTREHLLPPTGALGIHCCSIVAFTETGDGLAFSLLPASSATDRIKVSRPYDHGPI
jgi:hypothetical protein